MLLLQLKSGFAISDNLFFFAGFIIYHVNVGKYRLGNTNSEWEGDKKETLQLRLQLGKFRINIIIFVDGLTK